MSGHSRASILIGLLLLSWGYAAAQNVSFFKENITLQIEGEHLYVNGLYYLHSTVDRSTMLMYPFPLDSLYGEVDSLFIMDMNTLQHILPARLDRDKAYFSLQFAGGQDLVLNISYRQKLLGNKAEYILETTRYWGEPLQTAAYQLIVPLDLGIRSFSIPPLDELQRGGFRIFYWEKTNYMPDRNLVIYLDH